MMIETMEGSPSESQVESDKMEVSTEGSEVSDSKFTSSESLFVELHESTASESEEDTFVSTGEAERSTQDNYESLLYDGALITVSASYLMLFYFAKKIQPYPRGLSRASGPCQVPLSARKQMCFLCV